MAALSEKLKQIAELNFCKDCYQKYLVLIHGEIEYLLSEPIVDWRETEQNINLFWIKAKGFYTVKSGIFSPCENAFEEAYNFRNTMNKKLKFLKDKGLIKEYTYNFLDKVRDRRNKIHPPKKFSDQDYFLFQEAKKITNLMHPLIIFDLSTKVWNMDYIEKYARQLLEKTKLL
jgi:hypothetical protein